MTALTYSHKGTSPDEPVFFDIDLNTVPSGKWDLRVVVRDLTLDASVLSEETFRVLW